MQKEQIKTLLVNIAIIAVVVGVAVAGYFVFKGYETGVDLGSQDTTAQSTATMGAEITRTVETLRELSTSVKFSAMIFSRPVFQSLTNFSVGVSPEPIGRENPFTPTLWKLNYMKIIDASSGRDIIKAKTESNGEKVIATSLQATTTTPGAKTQGGLLADIDPSTR